MRAQIAWASLVHTTRFLSFGASTTGSGVKTISDGLMSLSEKASPASESRPARLGLALIEESTALMRP